MFLVLGIDAATWTVIRPNLDRLPAFKRLCETGKCGEIQLKEKPISPSVWFGIAITIVTTAKSKEEVIKLLTHLGFPFKK